MDRRKFIKMTAGLAIAGSVAIEVETEAADDNRITINVVDVTGEPITGARAFVFFDEDREPIIDGKQTSGPDGVISAPCRVGRDRKISGWIRCANSRRFYRQADVAGTVSRATGFSCFAILVEDF